ncbi:aromatic compound dioxygenase, partial [Cryphonectria parasitica EP155]
LLCLAAFSSAHPGHEEAERRAALERRDFVRSASRSLAGCADKLEANGVLARAAERRAATFAKYSKRAADHQQLDSRDLAQLLNTSHLSDLNVTATTPETELFNNSGTCILNPEGDVGPFYVLGESIRSNLTDGQPGVPLILDGQFLDVETCEPIENLYWDLWNCNTTGVYSGIAGLEGDINGNSADLSNLNATYLRGIQPTDADGVAQFQTVFPGHYSSRATHHHVIGHINATVLPNGTITGGNIAHVGQLFYDQDLIYAVEATYPYSLNTIPLTLNADDQILLSETDDVDSDSDPFIEYAYLGDDLSDGLFGWITIAVNVTASYDPTYRFVRTST